MNTERKELNTLLRLIDDPDELVYEAVSKKIMSMGHSVLGYLEDYNRQPINHLVHNRLDELIARLHFKNIKILLQQWLENPNGTLLEGALIINQYFNRELDTDEITYGIEKIVRNAWLELNNNLKPFEKISAVNSIFYNYYGFSTKYNVKLSLKDHLPAAVLQKKIGSDIGVGILYAIVCDRLDLPVYPIYFPFMFSLAFYDVHQHEFEQPDEDILEKPHLNNTPKPTGKPLFFINPIGGSVFSYNDSIDFMKELGIDDVQKLTKPIFRKTIIYRLLEQLLYVLLKYTNKNDGANSAGNKPNSLPIKTQQLHIKELMDLIGKE